MGVTQNIRSSGGPIHASGPLTYMQGAGHMYSNGGGGRGVEPEALIGLKKGQAWGAEHIKGGNISIKGTR